MENDQATWSSLKRFILHNIKTATLKVAVFCLSIYLIIIILFNHDLAK